MEVESQSPADKAGLRAGCVVVSAEGMPLRDLIDWRWYASEGEVTISYRDEAGRLAEATLVREPGQDWGIVFDGVIFDRVKECANNCLFCFMRQLPDDARDSLLLRDDDFRLSFLAGTFVTLTNLTRADEKRIVEQQLSPLRVSLHAHDSAVRKELIGRVEARGIEALERLLRAGIEFHAQIVLVPGINDGEVLKDTLEWAYGQQGIIDVGVVPLGYTKHQSAFSKSFQKSESARGVLDLLWPFQERAMGERGSAWVFAADEFYLAAYPDDVLSELPPSSHYGDFELFEDGIGIARAYVDDFEAACEEDLDTQAAEALERAALRIHLIQGEAMRPILEALLAESPLRRQVSALYVKNDYFGGNVDVTGLLCAEDIARAIRAEAQSESLGGAEDGTTQLFAIPRIIFNEDGVTLDGKTFAELRRDADVEGRARVAVVSLNPTDYLYDFIELAQGPSADAAR